MGYEGQYNQEQVNELYPNALMFDAMKVWKLPDNKEHELAKHCNSGEYFAQVKKDGNFYQIVTTADNLYLFSRTESKSTGLLTEKMDNVPHIKKAFSKLPQNTIILGEIYYPGLTSNECRTIMGCKAPLAIKRQNDADGLGKIHFYMHDIIFFNGRSLLEVGAFKRYEFLTKVNEMYNLTDCPQVELAEIYTDGIYEKISEVLDAGEEGMVLKKKDIGYFPGRKPAWSMLKVKKVDYADVVCMGFEDATVVYDGKELETWEYWINPDSEALYPKGCYYNNYMQEEERMFYCPVTKPHYYGWKTAIQIGAYNKSNELKSIGTVSSGLTDELRKSITEEPQKYIGEVLKVQVMEMFEGALRHPIFKGFRDDKNAKECTMDSIFS